MSPRRKTPKKDTPASNGRAPTNETPSTTANGTPRSTTNGTIRSARITTDTAKLARDLASEAISSMMSRRLRSIMPPEPVTIEEAPMQQDPILDPEILCLKCRLVVASRLFLPCRHLTHCDQCAQSTAFCYKCHTVVTHTKPFECIEPNVYYETNIQETANSPQEPQPSTSASCGANNNSGMTANNQDHEDEYEDETYEVERIVKSRGRGDSLEFLIVFKGWEDRKDWRWTNIADCDCIDKIRIYKLEMAKIQGSIRGLLESQDKPLPTCSTCKEDPAAIVQLSCGCWEHDQCLTCYAKEIGQPCGTCRLYISSVHEKPNNFAASPGPQPRSKQSRSPTSPPVTQPSKPITRQTPKKRKTAADQEKESSESSISSSSTSPESSTSTELADGIPTIGFIPQRPFSPPRSRARAILERRETRSLSRKKS